MAEDCQSKLKTAYQKQPLPLYTIEQVISKMCLQIEQRMYLLVYGDI